MSDSTQEQGKSGPDRTIAAPDYNMATAAGAPTAATLARAGRPTIPGYDLIEPVGRGGMGVVFRARQLGLDRDIAIKFLRDEFHPRSATGLRFLEEARITAQLQHPGIPAVHEVGTLSDGRPFLVMKLIRGRTLDTLLKEQGPGSSKWLAIFEAICQAVGFAHAHGVVHRDLKPSNVMVGAFGEVQVMDWGLAKVLGREIPLGAVEADEPTHEELIQSSRSGESIQTRAGSFLGTPAFMAPEQATGAVDAISPRTDVFGLGAVLCTLLTGRPPYLGTNSETTRLMAASVQLDEALERLDTCGAEKELVELCKRCLASKPGDRPADGAAVAKQIADLRSAADERARQAEIEIARTEVAAAEQRKRRRVQVIAAASVASVMLVGMITTGIYYLNAVRSRDEANRQKGIAETKSREAVKAAEDERLAREAAQRAEKKATEEKQISVATLKFLLEDLLSQIDPIKQANALMRSGGSFKMMLNPPIRELLDRATAQLAPDQIDHRFPGQPLVQGTILKTIGTCYRSLGDYKQAAELLARAEATFRTNFGEHDPNALEALSQLAFTYLASYRQNEALAAFKKVYDANTARHGADHGNTINALNNLALAYKVTGNVPEAIRSFERVLEQHQRIWANGDPNNNILQAKQNLADAYLAAREESYTLKAVQLLETLRDDRREKQQTEEHPNMLATLFSLADAYVELGRMEEAIALFETVRLKRAAIQGADHEDTLNAENNLAYAYQSVQLPEKAIPLLIHVRDVQIKLNGTDHPDSITATNNLAGAYKLVGNQQRAIELYHEAARGVVRNQNQYRAAKDIFTNLAASLESEQRFAEAEQWWRNWQLLAKQETGERSALYARTCAVLGKNLNNQKKWDEAIATLRECLSIRQEIEPGIWQTFNTQSMLGEAFAGARNYDQAQKALEEGYRGMLNLRASDAPPPLGLLIDAGDRLLALYEATKQTAKAEALKKELDRIENPPPR